MDRGATESCVDPVLLREVIDTPNGFIILEEANRDWQQIVKVDAKSKMSVILTSYDRNKVSIFLFLVLCSTPQESYQYSVCIFQH